MYAIVSIAGQQFKVEKGKKIFVHRLKGEVGDDVTFDKVLLISNDSKINVGAPYITDAVISAQIVSHVRGDKVLVFKKKRRKTYQKLNGHRQNFTEILIGDISESGTPAKAEKKKASAPVEQPAEVVAADVPEEKKAPKAKKTASKTDSKAKTTAEKAPEKKSAGKKPSAKAASKK